MTEVVADADRLLAIARQTLESHAPDSAAHQALTGAADLLGQLLLRDVARGPAANPDGATLKEDVAADRIVLVHDPELRHGRKSAARRFDGHQVAVAVDPERESITAVTMVAGNAPNNEQARALLDEPRRWARCCWWQRWRT